MKIINPLKAEFHQIIHINSFRTSQETHCISATNLSRLMLHRLVVAYSESSMKPTNATCEQNAEF
jgi:hypothetical protein